MSAPIARFPLGKYIFNILYNFFCVMSIVFAIFLVQIVLFIKSGVKLRKSAEVIINLMPSRVNEEGMLYRPCMCPK